MWATAVIATVALVALFVPIRSRVLLVEWPSVVSAYLGRRGKRQPALTLTPALAVQTVSGDAGVRWQGYTLVSAIEVAPDLAATMEDGGRSTTTAALPLQLVASLMRQFDIDIEVDIVCDGCQVPPGTAYRTVYSQVVGPHPLPGEKRTFLVLRMDVQKNLPAIGDRGPAKIYAPRVLTAITLRSAQRLAQEGIRAYALTDSELDEFGKELLKPVAAYRFTERWSTIKSGLNFVTSYVCAPISALGPDLIDQWWSWRTEATLMVLRLTRDDHGEVRVGAFVRYVTHGKAHRPLPEAQLALPTGVQLPMLESGLPDGDRSLAVSLPTTSADTVSGLQVAIGPSGQILGQTADGSTVAIPLWDQSGRPQRRRVEARLSLDTAHQIVLRAMVTGATVALHVKDRARWDDLVAAIANPDRLFYPTAGSRPSDIAVFDGRAITTVSARTVVRLLDERDTVSATADLVLAQKSTHELEVTIAGQDPLMVHLVRTRAEDRYLGLGEAPAPRRQAPAGPNMAVRAQRATPTPQPAPAPVPATPQTPTRGPARGAAAAGGRLDIAGPERTPRRGGAKSGAAQPQPQPSRQRRREYRLPTPEEEDRREEEQRWKGPPSDEQPGRHHR